MKSIQIGKFKITSAVEGKVHKVTISPGALKLKTTVGSFVINAMNTMKTMNMQRSINLTGQEQSAIELYGDNYGCKSIGRV